MVHSPFPGTKQKTVRNNVSFFIFDIEIRQIL